MAKHCKLTIKGVSIVFSYTLLWLFFLDGYDWSSGLETANWEFPQNWLVLFAVDLICLIL